MLSQETLNAINADILAITEQYTSGLITIQEYVSAISNRKVMIDNLDVSGLTCPNTGLRYPTKEETDKFISQFN
jgi:hypothetical protein